MTACEFWIYRRQLGDQVMDAISQDDLQNIIRELMTIHDWWIYRLGTYPVDIDTKNIDLPPGKICGRYSIGIGWLVDYIYG